MKRLAYVSTWMVWLLAATLVLAQETQPKIQFEILTDRTEAIYRQGEPATFMIRLLQGDQPLAGQKIAYQLSMDGVGHLGQGELTTQSQPVKVTGQLTQPGFLTLRATYQTEESAKNRIQGRGAAAYDPLDIKPSMPMPDDFDAFWEAEKAKVHAVPLEPKLTELPSPNPRVLAYDLQLDCPGSQRPVSGYLAMPKEAKPQSLAILLRVHWAGVFSAQRTDRFGEQNLICLEMNAHGILNGQPESYYNELRSGELKGYSYLDGDDPEKIYFHGMYLRLIRAMQYLKSLPQWDGKTLIVMGTSQGGGQAIVAAGLEPGVTLAIAHVPAMCDHTGLLIDRASGWPRLLNEQNKTQANRIRAARLHDAVNFAQRAKARLMVSVGFIDDTCAPTSIYAMYNAWSGSSKTVFNIPLNGHTMPPTDPAMRQALDQQVNEELAKAKASCTQ